MAEVVDVSTNVVNPVVEQTTQQVSTTPVQAPVAPTKDDLELENVRLQGIHGILIGDEIENIPTDYEEFRKGLNPEKLRGIYDYIQSNDEIDKTAFPKTFDSFYQSVGHTLIPGVEGVTQPKVMPHNLLTENAAGEKKIPFTDILIKDVQPFPEINGLPSTEVAKNAWEYMGNLAGKFNSTILSTAKFVGGLQDALMWAVADPNTLNPFHTTTYEEQQVGNAIAKANSASVINPLTNSVSVTGIVKWLEDKGVGGEGQKALPGKDIPMATDAVKFPMEFANAHEENFMAQGLSSLATISGELTMMGAMPTVKAGKVLSRIGMEYVPKAPVFFGAIGVRDSDNSHWYSPYQGAMQGVISGVEMEALGGLAGKWGKDIALGITKGTTAPFLEPFLVMGTNAALFAGDDLVKQGSDIMTSEKEWKDYDVNRTGQAGFMGIAMGSMGTTKGAFASFIEARGRQVRANMMMSWLSTERNVAERILKSNPNPEVIRERIDLLNDKISKMPKESGEVWVKAVAERNLLNTVISYNAQAKEILRDPDAFRMVIKNDPKIPDSAKEFLYNKVEETLQLGDPTYAKANRIQAEINQLNETLAGVDLDKNLSPEQLEAKKLGYTERLGSLKKELKDTYTKESFWLNGEEFNSESEFRAAVGRAKSVNDLSNAIVRNSPKVTEWVRQKQLDMATDEIKYGIRSQELRSQELQVDERIAGLQEKGEISTLPQLIVPDRVNTIIDRIDRGESIPAEHAQEASDILYQEYKRLEAMKASSDPVIKRNTTEQIQTAQDFLEEEITNLENYVDRAKGGTAPTREAIQWIKSEALQNAEPTKPVQGATATEGAAGEGTTIGLAQQGIEIMLAPYRSTMVTSGEQDKALRNSPEYVHHQEVIQNAADLVGVKILDKRDIWGGWEDTETGKPVQEVTQFIRINGTPEQARLLAAIMGKAAPEGQDAVGTVNHRDNATGFKHTVETGSFENGVEALKLLKDNGLKYFSMDKNTGDIIILDQEGTNNKNIITFVNQLNENGIKSKHYISKADTDFVRSDQYDGILASARSNPKAGKGNRIDTFIEKARGEYEALQREKLNPKLEKPNHILATGVDEVSAFLGDRMFNGEEPNVDRAITEMARELSATAKSPEEVMNGVKDILSRSVAGNDWASGKMEKLVNDRADLVRETYENEQPTQETAINKKGETTSLRGEINRIKEQEKTYRETLKEQLASEVAAKKQRGELVTVAGLSGEELSMYAKLASSYIREGAKTTKAVFDAVKADIKAITGETLKREDFDTMMEHTPEGERNSPRELMDVYDEIRTRAAEEKGGKVKTPEQIAIEKEIKVRREKTKVLVDEYVAMKDEIRLPRGAASEAKKSEKFIVDQSIQGMKDWIKENKARINEIAPDLTTTLANRLSVVKDQRSMDAAIEYIDAALQKEQFAKRAQSIDQNRKRAVQNLNNGKFGSLYADVNALTSFQYKKGKYSYKDTVDPISGDIKKILSISESNIPNHLLPTYDAILGKLAERGEIDVNAAELRNLVSELQPVIDRAIGKKLAAQEARVKMPDSAKAADIEMVRQAEKQETHKFLSEIDNVDTRPLTRDEREMLTEVRRYSAKDLEGLTTKQLRKARLIIEHVRDNGWLSNKLYEDVVKPVRQQRVLDKLSQGYDWAKVDAIGKFKDTAPYKELADMAQEFTSGKIDHVKMYNKLKHVPMDQMDMMLGGGVNTPIYSAIHHPFNIAISKMDAEVKGIEKGMQGLIDKVIRDNGSSREKKAQANVEMAMYVRAREYFSNMDNPKAKVKPLKDYVDAVIQSKIDRKSKELVQNVYESLPKTKGGDVDMKEFYDNFLTQSQKNLITYTDNVDRNILNPSIRFATNHYRGEAFVEVQNHAHRMAEIDIDQQVEGMLGGEGGFGGISTKGGTGHTRTGANTISFDFLGSFMRGVRTTMTDYHLTPVVKETFGTLKLLKGQHAKNLNATEMVQTIENMYHDNLKFQLADAVMERTIPTKLMKAMINGSYNSALAGIGRVGAELSSNISSAVLYDPAALMNGEIILRKHSGEMWDNLYETLGTSHMNRLGAQGDEFSRMLTNDVHRLSTDLGAGLGERTVDFLNDNWMRQQVTHINKGLIQFSDNTTAKPFWAGTFAKEFKRFTGKEFDMIAFTESPSYYKKYEQSMKDAAALADHHTTLMFNSAQGFDRALGTKSMPQDPWWLLKTVNNFLVGYGRREYYSSMMSIKAMMYGDQGISKTQGAKLMTAILVRNTVYAVAMQQMNTYKNQLLNHMAGLPQEDETKGKSVTDPQDLRRLGISTVANVVTGKYGQFARIGIAYGLNGLEQLYTEKVLDETYDQYKHSIMYTKGNIFTNPDNTKAWLGILGPMSYMTNALYDGVKLGGDIKEQFEDEDWLDGFKNATTDKGIQMQAMDYGFQLLNLFSVVPINREVKQVTNFLKFNAEDLGSSKHYPKNFSPSKKSISGKNISPSKKNSPSKVPLNR